MQLPKKLDMRSTLIDAISWFAILITINSKCDLDFMTMTLKTGFLLAMDCWWWDKIDISI